MLVLLFIFTRFTVKAQTGIHDLNDSNEDEANNTVLGEYLGGPCEVSCSIALSHVFCNQITKTCECEKFYPVRIGVFIGCAKPVRLGEQCFYVQTCEHNDPNSACIQVRHNAVCQCKTGFHLVTVQQPKRMFCSEDVVVINSDTTTLLGVATAVAVFTGLICFVLKLFVGSRPRHRHHYANSGHPLIFGGQQVSVLRGGSTYIRSGGVLVPSSRAGAARAAAILLISCHLSPSHGMQRAASVQSSTSSTKSFSARQFEREREFRLKREREKEGASPSQRSMDNLIVGPSNSQELWSRDEESGQGSCTGEPEDGSEDHLVVTFEDNVVCEAIESGAPSSLFVRDPLTGRTTHENILFVEEEDEADTVESVVTLPSTSKL